MKNESDVGFVVVRREKRTNPERNRVGFSDARETKSLPNFSSARASAL